MDRQLLPRLLAPASQSRYPHQGGGNMATQSLVCQGLITSLSERIIQIFHLETGWKPHGEPPLLGNRDGRLGAYEMS